MKENSMVGRMVDLWVHSKDIPSVQQMAAMRVH